MGIFMDTEETVLPCNVPAKYLQHKNHTIMIVLYIILALLPCFFYLAL